MPVLVAPVVPAGQVRNQAQPTLRADDLTIRQWHARSMTDDEVCLGEGMAEIAYRTVPAARGRNIAARAVRVASIVLSRAGLVAEQLARLTSLELRHKVEIHQMTGRVVECPIDEVNRLRGRQQARLRIPPSAEQVGRLFNGWRDELATCRKFAPVARNYTACKLIADVGLRVNEACKLDLADVKWDLGLFGKLHVRLGKGARGSGPRERMVPLINNAGATLRWFVEDVWAQFGDDHTRPGVPLLPSERKNADGSAARVGDEALRTALKTRPGCTCRTGPMSSPRTCCGTFSLLYFRVAIAAVGDQADLRPALFDYLLLAAACCGTL
ncbi:MAG: site-specific integrase [Streptosporangiaceae bacterium]|jgi:hypothetical protein